MKIQPSINSMNPRITNYFRLLYLNLNMNKTLQKNKFKCFLDDNLHVF